MLPNPEEMVFCIMEEGSILDGAHGLAIGSTEQEAWERALDPCEDWSIQESKGNGSVVRKCAIMVING